MHTTTNLARRTGSVVLVGALTAGVMLAGATAAQAQTHTGKVMVKTQRMSAATLKSHQSGSYAKGSKLKLSCYTRGQSVKGYYSRSFPHGYDNLWYRVSDGHYAADVDLNTGSNKPVTKHCPTPKPPAASAKAAHAATWAKSKVGSDSYDRACELFAENAYNTRGRYGTAIANYSAQKRAGRIHTSGTPSVGALVFSKGPYDGGAGHVAIYVGGGKYVSGGALKAFGTHHTVQYTSAPRTGGGTTYLGWATAPSSWPGR